MQALHPHSLPAPLARGPASGPRPWSWDLEQEQCSQVLGTSCPGVRLPLSPHQPVPSGSGRQPAQVSRDAATPAPGAAWGDRRACSHPPHTGQRGLARPPGHRTPRRLTQAHGHSQPHCHRHVCSLTHTFTRTITHEHPRKSAGRVPTADWPIQTSSSGGVGSRGPIYLRFHLGSQLGTPRVGWDPPLPPAPTVHREVAMHKLRDFSQTSGRAGVLTYGGGHELRRTRPLKVTQGEMNGARPGTQPHQPASQLSLQALKGRPAGGLLGRD